MARIPMTIKGAERLKTELKRLKTVERPSVMHALAEARSHGDISENADYDAAKERQGFLEARIRDIEHKLANAHVIDPRGILLEFGLTLPEDIEIRVWDSTAELRYIVLPERPAGTETRTEQELATLVTRDSMIGVSKVSVTKAGQL